MLGPSAFIWRKVLVKSLSLKVLRIVQVLLIPIFLLGGSVRLITTERSRNRVCQAWFPT